MHRPCGQFIDPGGHPPDCGEAHTYCRSGSWSIVIPMSVPHRMADPLAEGADSRHDGKAGAWSRAGTYSMNLGDEVVTGWHSHDLHQLVYALEGAAEVETETARATCCHHSRPCGFQPASSTAPLSPAPTS